MSEVLPHIIIILVCVVMSGYFSATETAFSTANKTRLKALAEKGDKKAALVLDISERYDRFISTVLIGNNIVNIAMASVGTVMFVKLCGDIGATVSTAVITVVVLIFGEITPKNIAKDMPERFARFSAPLINVLMYVFLPLNIVFSAWKRFVSRIIKSDSDDKMSQEELLMLVDEVEQEGSIDTDEGDLLRNAIEFTDRRAGDILTHRVDLETVRIDDTKEEIARVFTESRFSRLLVCDEGVDHIVGVIHSKDFYVGNGVYPGDIKEIITPPLFIHKFEKINDLLKDLQREKSHIAIVVDEYGGTLGIVTMEDILEELVGEIWDEHDEVVEDFKKLDETRFEVDCAMNFEDFCDELDMELESESVSVGGWVMEQLGRIAEVGDRFDFENLHVTVTGTDERRVTSIEVIKDPEETEEE